MNLAGFIEWVLHIAAPAPPPRPGTQPASITVYTSNEGAGDD